MAIVDINDTQYRSVAVGVTATGFRAPSGTRFIQIWRASDVAVRVQVADENANESVQDLDGQPLAAPAAVAPAVATSPSGGKVPAEVWHTVALSGADAPDVGDIVARPVFYLAAESAITADTEKCVVRCLRKLL